MSIKTALELVSEPQTPSHQQLAPMGKPLADPTPLGAAQLVPASGSGPPILAGSLCQEQPVLFILVRRQGCGAFGAHRQLACCTQATELTPASAAVICRADARRLWRARDGEAVAPTATCLLFMHSSPVCPADVAARGVKMICLVHETLPREVAAFTSFWGGDLYHDKNMSFWDALSDTGRFRKVPVTRIFARPCQTYERRRAAQRAVRAAHSLCAAACAACVLTRSAPVLQIAPEHGNELVVRFCVLPTTTEHATATSAQDTTHSHVCPRCELCSVQGDLRTFGGLILLHQGGSLAWKCVTWPSSAYTCTHDRSEHGPACRFAEKYLGDAPDTATVRPAADQLGP